ncbi:MAG: class I SAM-dependent methyltransferase [Aggregatilineales bacterium]
MGNDPQSHSQTRLGLRAQGCARSGIHAAEDDLDRLLALAAPQPGWAALDIAAGSGHTALAFASRVRRVVAADLTPATLRAAQRFLAERGAANVAFAAADAENMAFADSAFDLVTCRTAPHHFSDCFGFVRECARVLRPGGLLLIEDYLLPEDDRAARYIDAFERLRDPSHCRAYAEYEWRGLFLDAGLSVEHVETLRRSVGGLVAWAARRNCAPETIERLQVMLAQAPDAVRAWLNPRCAGAPDADFDRSYIIIAGRKQERFC